MKSFSAFFRSRIALNIFAAIMLVFIVSLSGCKDSVSDPANNNNNIGAESALIPVSYFHVKDSDGMKPVEGADVILFFEPGGNTQVYVATYKEAIAYKGRYNLENGKVHLKFNDADLVVDKVFSIDTSKETITLPFKIFSEGDGTSTWQKNRLPIEQTLMSLFNSITLSEGLSIDKVMDRVEAYANAYITIEQKAQTTGSHIESAGQPQLAAFSRVNNGFYLDFLDGTSFLVDLYNRFKKGPYKPLVTNPLASDPRVHLNCVSPGIAISDPDEKTALFIAPFDTVNLPAWTKTDDGKFVMDDAETKSPFGPEDNLEDQKGRLSNYGYTTKVIANYEANVDNIIKELAPGSGRQKSPGYVYFSTHGFESGMVVTGTMNSDKKKFNAEMDGLAAKYPDLFTYDGGTKAKPKTLITGSLPLGWRPKDNTWFCGITPKFWDWLRVKKNADFSRSFVYIGACLTDKSPDLRNAVRARAYFAYNISVNSGFAGAVAQYFVKSLVRPTHSAEESYYNIIRISNTQKKIYVEDNLFDNKIPRAADEDPFTVFKGYAWDGNNMQSLQENGWLKSMDTDPGYVWWLLFSSRWGQDAKSGLNGLFECWYNCWKDGNQGGLGNPGCQNKTVGSRVPTKNEIAYAAYLLLADMTFDAPNIKRLPRFTLNDGK